jgi:hypothetical protein
VRRLLLTIGILATMLLITASVSNAASTTLQVERFVYDDSAVGEEYVKICNVSASAISLNDYKVGDEETSGSTEGMYYLPSISLGSGTYIIIARRADHFQARFGFAPDYEFVNSNATPDLTRYTAWGSGSWALADGGDEIIILDPSDDLVDGICWGSGSETTSTGDTIVTDDCSNTASAIYPQGLKRTTAMDTDTTGDFGTILPNRVTLATINASKPLVLSGLGIGIFVLGLVALCAVVFFTNRSRA